MASLASLLRASSLVSLVLLTVSVACTNRVGQSCVTSDDCGAHEVCNYRPAACKDVACPTIGVCTEKIEGNSPCMTPVPQANSCATGKRIFGTSWDGCNYYFLEPVRDSLCP